MNQAIEISVIIPNYNYGNYIEECLRSVIESDFNNSKMEIIVVDDASTDNSVKIVNKIKRTTDISINLIRNKVNLGLAKTRNIGIKHAKGKYLFFLDSDNYIRKDCLKNHYKCLNNSKKYAACYAPIQRFDNETKILSGVFSNKEYDYYRLMYGNYIDNMSMIKKKDLIEIGLYDEQMPYSGWEDYELWLRMGLNNKKVYFIAGEPLTCYRVHKDSMIHNLSAVKGKELMNYIKTKFNFKGLEDTLLKSSPLLDKISVKVYYAGIKSDFSENKSLLKEIKLNDYPEKESFDLPPGKDSYNFIRFDIGDMPGLVNIHEIEIKNKEGEILWKWDKYTIEHKNYLFLLQNEELWPDKIVQLSTGRDPQFLISTNEEVQKQSSRGVIVEISLSSLNEAQFNLINNLTTPFTCVSEKQFKDIQQKKEAISTEKNKLEEIIEIAHQGNKDKENKIGELGNAINGLQETLANKEIELANLKTTLSNKDIAILNLESILANKDNKIGESGNAISGLQETLANKEIELANLKTTLSNKDNKIEELDNAISGLQETLSKKEIEWANLKTTLSNKDIALLNLETTLSNKDTALLNLETILSNKDTALLNLQTTLSNKDTALLNLETSISKKDNKIGELGNAINGLQETLSRKEIELSDLKITLSNKDAAILNLESTLANKDNKIGELGNAINGLQETLSRKETELADLKTTLSNKDAAILNLESTLANKDNKIGELSNVINGLQETLSRKETKLADLKTTLSNKDAAILNLETSISNKDNKILELSSRITTLEGAVSNEETINAELKKVNQKLTGNLNNELNKTKELLNKIELLEKDILGIKQKNTEVFNTQNNTIRELEKELEWYATTYENRKLTGIISAVITAKNRRNLKKKSSLLLLNGTNTMNGNSPV